MLSATFHFEYHRLLEELKNEYAPFDPDECAKPIVNLTAAQRAIMLDKLFERFGWLMERANFKHLDRQEIARQAANILFANMGIGAFITVSWALATDIVPRAEAARYLGIANIATCIGSGVARLLGGVLIDPINHLLGSSSSGYLALFILAAICFLVSALVVIPLPNKKKLVEAEPAPLPLE